jgi:N-acetylglucosamine-6-phosphate deacetylase
VGGNRENHVLKAGVILRPEGFRSGVAHWDGARLHVEDSGAAGASSEGQGSEGFFVSGLPVEIHCHGMGGVDFSEFASLDLIELNLTAAAEGVQCVPTLYMRHDRLDEFVIFMRRFDELRRRGLLPHVPGIALEGPLLASHGGTPASTVWPPTREEWIRIAECGALGLVYTVMSPDALTPASDLHDRLTREHPDLEWIVRTLVEHGVRPALGHYTRSDPRGSAALTESVTRWAWDADSPIVGVRVVTDHLFNDMPLTIRHAFRTRAARRERDAALASYDLASWNLSDLDEQVGHVPAAIMRLCHEGVVASCVNFDGEHVDLDIAARAVQVIGGGNIMLMTDRCDTARLGGQALHQGDENGLWYQDGGIVAAGSQPMDRQLENVRRTGLDEHQIWSLIAFTPARALGLDRDPWLNPDNGGCFVLPPAESATGRRVAVLCGSAV